MLEHANAHQDYKPRNLNTPIKNKAFLFFVGRDFYTVIYVSIKKFTWDWANFWVDVWSIKLCGHIADFIFSVFCKNFLIVFSNCSDMFFPKCKCLKKQLQKLQHIKWFRQFSQKENNTFQGRVWVSLSFLSDFNAYSLKIKKTKENIYGLFRPHKTDLSKKHFQRFLVILNNEKYFFSFFTVKLQKHILKFLGRKKEKIEIG